MSGAPEPGFRSPRKLGPLIRAGALGLCPSCGARTLFSSPAGFAERCSNCGADFSRYNVGDGPAALLTLAVGAIVLTLALLVEFGFHPPMWVHILLWFPLTVGLVIGSLRVAKGMLLHLEHRNDAGEGRQAS